MSSLVRSPLILYASETGNAEDVAFSLHRQWNHLFASQSVNFRIFSVEDYDVFSLTSEELVIFVLSTCGDGEFPIPMRTMWTNLLRRNLPPGLLSESKFAVFGLGDSSYEKFNAAARKLYVRLGQLGAKPLLEFTDCLGDDQAGEGYLASLDPWTKKLTPLLWKELVQGESTTLVEGALTTAAVKSSLIQYTVDSASQGNGPQEELFHPLGKKSHENDNWKVYKTSVSENNRLTAADWSQAVHNVTFTLIDATDPALDYEAGDIAQLYYSNPKVLVDPLLTYFSDDNRVVNIIAPATQYRRSRLQGSLSCSLVELFRDVLDIGSIPKRSFFEALAVFAENDEERDKLLEISSARGADLYYDYCLRERRNYTEVLLDFPSVRIPLEFFIGLVPIIQPRPYSIASSPKYKERSVSHFGPTSPSDEAHCLFVL
jgi:sulfite reductase alpha subunit-like flavoprotein